ncbi:extracellular solute-binding protein [Paenibacillus hodogayensis]|uniref:Extracellular solute-binding protein n=1 Tax=Paenibacillus hodogayensis TaxID=279208 RepID=A0ABV5VXE5_9BACL
MSGKQKGMLALLAAALLLTSTACGKSGPNASDSNDKGGSSPATPAQPVSLKIMGNYDQANLSETDKKMVELLEKKTNTKVTFEIPPLTGYNERLQLMLASGDYPDLVFFPSTNDPSFLNAMKDGILLPVNDYIKNAKNLQKHTYDTSWDALKVKQDDKMYGIPRTSVTRNDQFWVRKDWLNNVGITLPDNAEMTIDQFTDMLRKFTKEDPDKNGKNDTFGLAANVNGRKVLDPVLTGPFGLTGWQKTAGGKYDYIDPKYDPSSDAYKKALAFTNDLYKEGLLDPDAATNDATKARERFWKGITGVFPGFAGHYTWHTDEMRKLNPNVELTYVFVKDEKGQVKGGGYASGLWGFWALTKSAKNPQQAVDFLDAYLSDELWPTVSEGFEGSDYKVENGQKVAIPNPPTSFVRKNTMRRANDTDFFIAVGTDQKIRDMIMPWLKKSVDTVVRGKDLDFTPDAAKKPELMDYQKAWDQTVMKIILGQTPVAKFDDLLSGWYKAGGEDYVKQMNDFIKKIESAKK